MHVFFTNLNVEAKLSFFAVQVVLLFIQIMLNWMNLLICFSVWRFISIQNFTIIFLYALQIATVLFYYILC